MEPRSNVAVIKEFFESGESGRKVELKELKEVLMERDGMTEEEAKDEILACREDLNYRLSQGDMPYDICEEWFGLEPDYLDELMI